MNYARAVSNFIHVPIYLYGERLTAKKQASHCNGIRDLLTSKANFSCGGCGTQVKIEAVALVIGLTDADVCCAICHACAPEYLALIAENAPITLRGTH
jgi:hypothetical protein